MDDQKLPGQRLETKSINSSPKEILHTGLALDQIAHTFRVIGLGSCGVVFSHHAISHVLKRELPQSNQLWNDLVIHTTVQKSFDQLAHLNISIRVPRCYGYINTKNEEFWKSNCSRFPERYKTPGNLLISERIPPLPRSVRNALIDLYLPSTFPQASKDAVKEDPSNRDCLARIYLGKRRDSTRRPSRMFTLRNFNLHMDQMEELSLDVQALATGMADALAIMHWHSKIDADDVEFVLGSLPPSTITADLPSASDLKGMPPNSDTNPVSQDIDLKTPTTGIWLLDFNRCHDISMDATGLQQAVKAFFRNDPYYPCPLGTTKNDECVWQVFRNRYLKTSVLLADEENRDLPELFMAQLVEEAEARDRAKRARSEAGGVGGVRDAS